MIDLSVEPNLENTELLLKGMMYSELPPLIDFDKIFPYIEDVFDVIDSEQTKYYSYNERKLIDGFKGIPETPNRHKNGAEPIVFFDFKNNGAWREMQIPNAIYYIAFVYNTMSVFNELFEPLYLSDEYLKYRSNSNSYLVFEDIFVLHDEYSGDIDFDIKGRFTDRNTKKISSLFFEKNKKRYLKEENSFLYYLKLDIESFFPNLYTHFFDRIKDNLLYDNLDVDEYFAFLDSYNMKISNNQTKGIPAGVFSSHISSELLMLCVDNEIRDRIKDMNVGYIRYVDDMTFFADQQELLYEIKAICQQVLNKYRLRINGNKTEIQLCTRKRNQTDIKNIDIQFPFLEVNNSDEKDFSLKDLMELKDYIATCLADNRKSQIKALLTKITNKISNGLITFDESAYEFFVYIWKLIGEDEKLTIHVYRLLDEFLNNCGLEERKKCLEQLIKKVDYIDRSFSDSILQIWHYYLIMKYDHMFKNNYLNEIEEICPDPIIASLLIEKESEKNRKLYNYIRNKYKEEIFETGNNWKNSIMLSKWWLPLFIISIEDDYNYDGWIHSSAFPDVLRCFSAE